MGKRPYKMAKCVGQGDNADTCVPTKIKTRKIKFVCPDGSSSRKEVEIVRKCGRKKAENLGIEKKIPHPPHFVKTHKLELVLHDDYCHLQYCAQWENVFFFIFSNNCSFLIFFFRTNNLE